MRRVLLTGGTGFIGRNAIPFLIKKGYEVHATFNRHKIKIEDQHNVIWHHCDLFDPKMQKSLLQKILPTHLLHFAWETTPGKYWTSLENLLWVRASVNLIINFTLYGGQRAVFSGTCAEYDWSFGHCKENITPLNPPSLYGASKILFQEILELYNEEHAKLSSAWGRTFHTYGPCEHPNRLVPEVINAVLNGHQAKCSRGKQIRDFLYVKDVADAYVALLGSDVEGVVNIASGTPVKIMELIKIIAVKLDCQKLVKFGALKTGINDPAVLTADTDRLNFEVCWLPKFDLDEGLNQTIKWWVNNK